MSDHRGIFTPFFDTLKYFLVHINTMFINASKKKSLLSYIHLVTNLFHIHASN